MNISFSNFFKVQRKVLLVLFICLITLNLHAQNKIKGLYNVRYREFEPIDTGIIVNRSFNNGLAPFMIKGKNPFDAKTNRVGFIDTTGKVIIKPKYTDCSVFNGEFALAYDTAGQAAVINIKGKTIIPFEKQFIRRCQNGLFEVYSFAKRSISFVNKEGKTIVPFGRYIQSAISLQSPIYREGNDVYMPQPFSWHPLEFNVSIQFKRIIGVRTKIKWALIDSTGREVVPPTFDAVGIFNNGLAPVKIGEKFGVIDTAGNVIVPAKYDYIEISKGNFIIATKEKKIGVLDMRNQLIIPFEYDHISQINNKSFLADTGHHYALTSGILSVQNKMIIPMQYRSITDFGSGYLVYSDYGIGAVFDSLGVQKTDWIEGGELHYPVWETKDSSIVYNEQARHFVKYEYVHDLEYKRNEKWGLLDSTGVEIAPPFYNRFQKNFIKNTIIAEKDNHWGIINNRNQVLLPFDYDGIEPINQDYIIVKKDKKFGLVNGEIKLVTAVKFDHIDLQYNEYYNDIGGAGKNIRATVNQKWGLLNYRGREITLFKFDALNENSDGFYSVSIDNKRGLVDHSGVEILPCIYDQLFRGRLPFIIVEKDGTFGLMDKKGKKIAPLIYQAISETTLHGKGVYYITYKSKIGIFNDKAKQVFPFLYDYVQPIDAYPRSSLPANLKSLINLQVVRDKGLYGIADSTGKIVVPLLYDFITTVFNVYHSPGINFIVTKNKKESILNSNGKLLVPFIYSSLQSFGDSLLIALDSNRRFGLINWTGKIIAPFAYNNLTRTYGGYIILNGNKEGVLGLDGKEVLHADYDYVSSCYCSASTYFVSKDHKTGMVDITGKVIVPLQYDSYDVCGGKFVKFIKGKLMGLFDMNGKVIYPCKYTYINCVDGKVVEIY